MRNPVRSEADAFHIAVGCAVLIAASLALGSLLDLPRRRRAVRRRRRGRLLLGARHRGPGPSAPAPGGGVRGTGTNNGSSRPGRREPHPAGRRAARRTSPPRARRNRVPHRRADPLLRIHYLASDVDKELDDARERLSSALAWARDEGFAATGKVGDPNAALGAIEYELRQHGADEVIISTYPRGTSNWLETGIVDRLRDELEIPVTHVVVQSDRVSRPAAR